MSRRLFLILLLLLLSGCGAPPLADLPADEIVARMVERMKATSGFHFVIERSGVPAFLDDDETIAFRRAEGDFIAPDQAQAKVRVIGPGLVVEAGVISAGEQYWQTNLLTNEWEAYPPEMGFNPAILFDPEIGFQPLLKSDLADLVQLDPAELEDQPGVRLYHLVGKLDGARLHEMSYGMIGPEPVNVELWVAPQSFELHRVILLETVTGEDEPTQWQVDFWDFDSTIVIQPPVMTSHP